MAFSLFSFTVRIERSAPPLETQLARYRQEQLLRAREEAHAIEAAQMGIWA